MAGWMKLHRKLLDSNMYKSLNSKQRDVLFSCLMMSNYTDNEWEFDGEIFKCKPGQFITSLDSIAKNCGKDVKVQSVRTALLKLEKWHFLTNKSTKTGRLITICKWDTYQSEDIETNKDSNKDLTKNQQRPNKDLTPIEEGKEGNKDKKDKNKDIPSTATEVPEHEIEVPKIEFYLTAKKKKLTGKRLETFNKFWEAFNYKKSKSEAADAWLAIPLLNGIIFAAIIKAAEHEAIQRPQILNTGKTPKMAQGWITSKRWEDEFIEAKPIVPLYETSEQIKIRTQGNAKPNF